MSLKQFHILFIAISTLLAMGFGEWCVQAYLAGESNGYLAFGVLSYVAVGILIVYAWWFIEKMRASGLK